MNAGNVRGFKGNDGVSITKAKVNNDTLYVSFSNGQVISAGSILGSNVVPAGCIMAFGGDTSRVPNGWLLCDGRSLKITDSRYSALYQAIGTSWGSVATGFFNLPYTNGIFLRGASNGQGYDLDKSTRTRFNGGNSGDKVGSFQSDQFKSHTHIQNSHFHTGDYSGNNFLSSTITGSNANSGTVLGNFQFTNAVTATNQNTGGNESRPVNVYVNYIIKL